MKIKEQIVNGEREGGELITEIVRIALREGVEVRDLEDGARFGRNWRKALETVAKQDGCTNSYYGSLMEEDGVVVWCIDWHSLAHHKSFMTSPTYTEFLENLSPILKSASMIHVSRLAEPTVTENGCTEMAMFFDIEEIFMENLQTFISNIRALGREKKIAGFGGWMDYGEVVEKIGKGKISKGTDDDVKEEEKGRAVVLLLGWESKEAHMAFRDTKYFKENIGLLEKGTSGYEMFHVSFKSGRLLKSEL